MVNFAYKIQTIQDRRILKPDLESLKCLLYIYKVKVWGCQLLKIYIEPQAGRPGKIAVKTRKGGWTEEHSVKNENRALSHFNKGSKLSFQQAIINSNKMLNNSPHLSLMYCSVKIQQGDSNVL